MARKKVTKGKTKGKRYTDAEKKNILATAAKEGLTGAQVRERFGVSTLSFYRWRGPVASKRRGDVAKTANGRMSGGQEGLRDQVRQTVREILPGVIRAEVSAYLDGLFSRPRRGRPRKSA